MIKRTILGLAAGLTILASPATAATNLVSNGSFENGIAFTTPYVTVNAPDVNTSITDWSVTSGSVDYIGSYWKAQDGNRSIDLAGVSLGTLQQTISNLVIGQTYLLQFWSSKNPDNGAPIRTGTVNFGDGPMTFAYAASNSLANMQWQLNSYWFVADSTSTLLSFAADATAGCCFGPALDNVSIAAVPEPEVWAMLLLGFGAVGFQMRRRRKLQAVTA